MLDRFLLPPMHQLLQGIATTLYKRGWSADRLTMLAFGSGIASSIAIASGAYVAGLVLLLLNRLGDGLDGMVARLHGPTSRGTYLDIVLDFIFYAAVVFGFAVADPTANGLPAAALLFSFIGTGTSFLAFAIQAEKCGLTRIEYGHKGFYYMGGLTEGAETIMFFVVCCLFPHGFPWFAWIFSALCLLTVVGRLIAGYRTLR